MFELVLQTTADDGFEWPIAIFLTGFFFAVAAVVCVGLWQGLATWRSRMAVAREEAYQSLANEMATMSQETSTSLKTLQADVAEIRQRTAEMERLLKEID